VQELQRLVECESLGQKHAEAGRGVLYGLSRWIDLVMYIISKSIFEEKNNLYAHLLAQKFLGELRVMMIEVHTPFAAKEWLQLYSECQRRRNIENELLPEETISLSILQLKKADNIQRPPHDRVLGP